MEHKELGKNNRLNLPFNPSFFYGWVIVAVAALAMFFSGPGQTYSISVFIDAYISDLGWSRSLLSSIYSAASLTAGLTLFMMGRLIDRFGHRKMILITGLFLGFASVWNSYALGPVWMFIGFFMLRLFGQGTMTLIPGTLVPQWFILKRGRALSLMAVGWFAGATIIPPLNVWIVETFHWSTAWKFWGVLLIFFFVPTAFYLIRNRPEDVGLNPDGTSIQYFCGVNEDDKQLQNPKQVTSGDHSAVDLEINWTFEEVRKTRTFWLILIATAIPALVNTAITFHLISLLGEKGISTQTAGFILSLMAIMGFAASMITGFIVERVKIHYVLAFILLGEVIVLFSLYLISFELTAILFGILWGFLGGVERITLGYIWPHYYGRKHLGSIKGVASTAMVIGAALGPLPMGIAFDVFGGYTESIFLMMSIPLLGMVFSLISPRPVKKNPY